MNMVKELMNLVAREVWYEILVKYYRDSEEAWYWGA